MPKVGRPSGHTGLTRSFTPSLPPSLLPPSLPPSTHSLTHSLTPSLTHSLTHSLCHPVTLSLCHSAQAFQAKCHCNNICPDELYHEKARVVGFHPYTAAIPRLTPSITRSQAYRNSRDGPIPLLPVQQAQREELIAKIEKESQQNRTHRSRTPIAVLDGPPYTKHQTIEHCG